MSDASPRVVEHAVRLAEPRLDKSPALLERVATLAEHTRRPGPLPDRPEPGATPRPDAVGALAHCRRDAADPWMRLAVLASAGDSADLLFTRLARSAAFRASEPGGSFLEQLAGVVGARNRPDELARMLGFCLARAQDPSFVRRAVLALGRGMSRSGGHFAHSLRPVANAREPADRRNPRPRRPRGGQREGRRGREAPGGRDPRDVLPWSARAEVLASLLDPRHPQRLQLAAPPCAGWLQRTGGCGSRPGARPSTRSGRSAEAIDTLLSREPWTLALLRAAKEGRADVSQVDPRGGRGSRSTGIPRSPRWREESSHEQRRRRCRPGRSRRVCSRLEAEGRCQARRRGLRQALPTCHRVGNVGHSVGPDLTATQFREPDALMTHILEPNRFIPPNYVQYLVSDRSGRVYSRPDRFGNPLVAHAPPRRGCRRHHPAKPDRGADEHRQIADAREPRHEVTHQEMADLLAYLLSAHRGTPESGRLDIGTEAGAIEPEK